VFFRGGSFTAHRAHLEGLLKHALSHLAWVKPRLLFLLALLEADIPIVAKEVSLHLPMDLPLQNHHLKHRKGLGVSLKLAN
jgi:hypothetical protein